MIAGAGPEEQQRRLATLRGVVLRAAPEGKTLAIFIVMTQSATTMTQTNAEYWAKRLEQVGKCFLQVRRIAELARPQSSQASA